MLEEIKTKIQKIVGEVKFSVEEADSKFGDYSTNVAMMLGKERGKNPQSLAEEMAAELSKDDLFEKVEAVRPGFINFRLSSKYLQRQIFEITKAGEHYGDTDLGNDLKINVEFISANPTGPLTLGNGRGAYTGDTLANVLTAFGAEVEREYYINDRGAQIVALGHSILKDDQAVYKGDYIDDLAKKIKVKEPKAAGEEAASILMEESIKKTIQRMGIRFDHWFSESGLFKGPVEEVLGRLQKRGLTYEKEGALWLKTSKFGDDKDRVLITGKKEYTYFAADLAYHWLKIKRGYTGLFDIWGADHHGYIGRMKAGVDILAEELESGIDFEILIAQLVRVISKGKEVKMSKRAGTFVTIDELIDEVGSDVVRFFFLHRALNTHLDFDLDLAKEKNEKNPVYYIQYAYTRIHSILVKYQSSNTEFQINSNPQNLNLLETPAELALIKELLKLPDLVMEIAENYQVQKMPFYALELARKFHEFYEKCRVISEDKNLTFARIKLIWATQIVFKKTLDLMGISAPKKM